MKFFSKFLIVSATVLLALSVMCMGVSATSYTYSKEGNHVHTPDAADVQYYLDKEYCNWGKMGIIEPSDLAVAPNGNVYIADAYIITIFFPIQQRLIMPYATIIQKMGLYDH